MYKYAHICAYLHAYLQICIQICTNLRIFFSLPNAYFCIFLKIRTYLQICMHICTNMRIFLCILCTNMHFGYGIFMPYPNMYIFMHFGYGIFLRKYAWNICKSVYINMPYPKCIFLQNMYINMHIKKFHQTYILSLGIIIHVHHQA